MKNLSNKKIGIVIHAVLTSVIGTGCFGTDSGHDQVAPIAISDTDAARSEMLNVMDQHLTRTAGLINEVILGGDFLSSLAETPPELIPLNGDEEVKQALQYLFSDAVNQNGQVVYSVDSRLCTDYIAKNDPVICGQAATKIHFVQTQTGSGSGTLQMTYDNYKPLMITYSESEVSSDLDLFEARAVFEDIVQMEVARGNTEHNEDLPEHFEGMVGITFSKIDDTQSSISLAVKSAIKVTGVNSDGKPQEFNIASSLDLALLTLNGASKTASLSLNVPSFQADSWHKDDSETYREVYVDFPGIKGTFSLDNAAKMFLADTIELIGSKASMSVDGSPSVEVTANPLTASLAVTDVGPKFGFGALDISATFNAIPGIVDETGSIALYSEAGIEITVDMNAKTPKVTSGSATLTGTGQFEGQFELNTGDCFDKGEGNPDILTAKACE